MTSSSAWLAAAARRGADSRGRAGDRTARAQRSRQRRPALSQSTRGSSSSASRSSAVRGRDGRSRDLHLPVEAVTPGRQGEGTQITKRTGPNQALDQLLHRVNRGAARLVQLFPPRGLIGDIRLPARTTPIGGWSAGCAVSTASGTGAGCAATYLKERWPAHNGVELFNPVALGTSRYRYRGAQIPLPWTAGYVALRDHATAMDYLEGLIAR